MATIGTNGGETSLANPISLGITMSSLQYPNGTFSIGLSGVNPAWRNNGSSTNVAIVVYLCDSAGNNKITLFTVNGFTSAARNKDTPNTATINNTSKLLKGQALYIVATGNTSSIVLYGQATVTVGTKMDYTNVTAGNKIYKTDLSQKATPDDATLIKYRTQFSQGTLCSASTMNSWLNS